MRRRCLEWSADFWSDFSPCTPEQLRRVERELRRELPLDLKQFLLTFGTGQFRHGGHIADTDEIIENSPAATIYYPIGSYDWASPEEHATLWVSRGDRNPAPDKFTQDALTIDGIYLLDWLQVGSDGSCGYHTVYVGDGSPECRYHLMCPGPDVQHRLPSFSAGLHAFLNEHWDLHFNLLDA